MRQIIDRLTSSKDFKATLIILIAKGFGIIRELALYTVASASPEAVNLYFLASQSAIGIREKWVESRVFYAIILLSIFVMLQNYSLFLFFTIFVPFLLWPLLQRIYYKRFGYMFLIVIMAIFNLASVMEIFVVNREYTFVRNYTYGLPIISLWIVIGCLLIGTLLLKNNWVINAIPRGLIWTLMIIVLIRLLMLKGVLSTPQGLVLYTLHRAIEIFLPQFANFKRLL